MKPTMTFLETLFADKGKYMFKPDEASALAEKLKLDDNDKLLALNHLASDDVFYWLDYISLEIIKLAADSQVFANLVGLVSKRIRRDMAQGSFNNALIELGSSKPEIALKIYDRLVKLPDRDKVLHQAGLLLGGVGRVEAKKEAVRNFVLNNVKRGFRDGEKAAMIAVAQVMLEPVEELDKEAIAFYTELLDIVTDVKQGGPVRAQAVLLSLLFYSKDKKKNETYLRNTFASPIETQAIYTLLERLWIRGIENIAFSWNLVQQAADLKNENLNNTIANFLANKHKENPDLAFKIFTQLVKHKSPPRELYYVVEKFAKENFDFYKTHLRKLIEESSTIEILYELSHLIEHHKRTESLKAWAEEIEEMIQERITAIYAADRL